MPASATLSKQAALSLLAGVSGQAKQALMAHTQQQHGGSLRPEQELSQILLDTVSRVWQSRHH